MTVWIDTAEPVEIILVIVAFVSLLLNGVLFVRAYETAVLAEIDGRCEAVQRLAWLRVRNEGIRALIVGLIFAAGVIQALHPPPLGGSGQRPYLQAIWLLIAFGNLAMSVTNDRTVRKVIAVIERERSAGRMR